MTFRLYSQLQFLADIALASSAGVASCPVRRPGTSELRAHDPVCGSQAVHSDTFMPDIVFGSSAALHCSGVLAGVTHKVIVAMIMRVSCCR